MRLYVTYVTGITEEFDTSDKLTASQLDFNTYVQVRQRLRLDRLEGFEDREDGLWLEIWGARYDDANQHVMFWTPICMVRQLTKDELGFVSKLMSSRDGGIARLEFCRYERDDGESVLLSLSRARWWLDTYATERYEENVSDIVYVAFRTWCRRKGNPVAPSFAPGFAEAAGLPHDIVTEIVIRAIERENGMYEALGGDEE